MKIKDVVNNDVVVFHLGGKIMGGPEVTMFHGKVHEYVEAGKKKAVIDLADVEWINSSGIGMLISTLATLKRSGGDLRIANVPGKIGNLLNIVQIERIMRSHDSVEEAIKSF